MHAFVRNLVVVILIAAAAHAPAAGAPAGEPRFEPEDLRADFAALYEGLQAAHYDLYARRPRHEYDRLYARMRRDLDAPLALDEVERRFQRFVAYGNVAHARIDAAGRGWEAFRAAGGKAFPLFLRVVDGRVYVAGNRSGDDGIAPGDRVVSIEGRPALQWLDALRTHLSADNDYLAHAQLESLLPLYAWLEHGEVDAFAVVVEKRDGSRVERTLPARTRAEFTAAESAQPKAFELDWNAREARVVDGVGYLRPGPFYDNRPDASDPWDTAAFRTFIDGAFERFVAEDVKRIVIDLRDNPGGDNSFSDLMVAWFATKPFRFTEAFDIKVSEATAASNRKRIAGAADSISKRFDAAYAAKKPGDHVRFEMPEVPPRTGARYRGAVDVLVNRHSYSNTVMVAAIVQDYGFGRVLGEETADLASTYGAMETFTLPRTGIVVGYPKARILRPNGDPRARGVVPDVVIDTPVVPARDDVVLARALALPAADAGDSHRP